MTATTTLNTSTTTATSTRTKLSPMARLAYVSGVALLLVAPAAGATSTHILRTTATYKLTLDVGPVETMYTQAELKAKHPTRGEVMVGGSMAMGDMSMSGANRHLEVHVASRSTGKVVTNAQPAIVLTDTTSMGRMTMAQKVNAMAMQGIGEGIADLHYGDNVKLTAGHVYKVVVTVKGEKATFSFTA
jgi:hypothetical protein